MKALKNIGYKFAVPGGEPAVPCIRNPLQRNWIPDLRVKRFQYGVALSRR